MQIQSSATTNYLFSRCFLRTGKRKLCKQLYASTLCAIETSAVLTEVIRPDLSDYTACGHGFEWQTTTNRYLDLTSEAMSS